MRHYRNQSVAASVSLDKYMLQSFIQTDNDRVQQLCTFTNASYVQINASRYTDANAEVVCTITGSDIAVTDWFSHRSNVIDKNFVLQKYR